jgi:hypothetical protein
MRIESTVAGATAAWLKAITGTRRRTYCRSQRSDSRAWAYRPFRGEVPALHLETPLGAPTVIRPESRGNTGACIASILSGGRSQIMQVSQPRFPVHVRMGWIDFSPALQAYVTQRVRATLGAFASRIRSVRVRIADHEPHDPASRLCAIEVELKPVGALSAVSTGRGVYELVNDATDTILARLSAECGGSEPLSRTA